ncbi:MAG TPA: L-fuculose-phosphate aldolase [Chloroflexi bacterium]|jgi:L-fuculose-phosphate aldolase|nr:L-fuculose-phosphate aldolase [Chloroflexota bacterium]HPO57279.1 L-fuculose-phosphate aldolase [Anaerolineaceae bacterium]
MRLQAEREAVAEYGRKLITSQLSTGTGGNLSVYNRAEGLIAISPSGMDYFAIRPEDVVVVDLDGCVVEGSRKPSSELRFHLDLMRHRPDVNAVVHTHQVYATTLACLRRELPAVHYLVAFSGNKVPLADYATYGTQELSDNILRAIGPYNACLMANHGLVTVGPDLPSAFATAEVLELSARLYIQARSLGEPAILPDEEMERVARKFQSYGQK